LRFGLFLKLTAAGGKAAQPRQLIDLSKSIHGLSMRTSSWRCTPYRQGNDSRQTGPCKYLVRPVSRMRMTSEAHHSPRYKQLSKVEASLLSLTWGITIRVGCLSHGVVQRCWIQSHTPRRLPTSSSKGVEIMAGLRHAHSFRNGRSVSSPASHPAVAPWSESMSLRNPSPCFR
jgi:hypothetical protein